MHCRFCCDGRIFKKEYYLFLFDFFGLAVKTVSIPMAGVKKILIKKTPQNPNLVFFPINPNTIESTM